MKGKLLLTIADMYEEFTFRVAAGIEKGFSEQYLVQIQKSKLTMSEILKLNEIEPFVVSIEKTEKGFQFDFKIKS